MPSNSDIRWKQRFQSFDRGWMLLREALAGGIGELNQLEKEGVIQRFEYCFELAWKTAKDFLEYGGVVIQPVSPRQVIKEAFAAGIIADGKVWIEMLDQRNLLSHTYDLAIFEQAAHALASRYAPAIQALHTFFATQNAE